MHRFFFNSMGELSTENLFPDKVYYENVGFELLGNNFERLARIYRLGIKQIVVIGDVSFNPLYRGSF
jgi:hypothetical protein